MSLLTLAIATGRIAKGAIRLLKDAGIEFPEYEKNRRKLVVYDQEKKIKLIFVKTADMCTYIEKGAADVGIIGKDTIMEYQPDIYEFLDLKFGVCKLAVAGFPETDLDDFRRPITVASKYPKVAEQYFMKQGKRVEAILLNGSVELAPLIGLSDVIVDIVETGTTLKQNGLVVLEEIASISARLIVNKASYATKTKEVQMLIEQLERALEGTL